MQDVRAIVVLFKHACIACARCDMPGVQCLDDRAYHGPACK